MLELTAIIFSLISVVLTIKNKIWCWHTGIVGIVCYFFIFLGDKNWSNMLLQALFIIQSVYGYLTWHKDSTMPIIKGKLLPNIILTIVLFVFCYAINTYFNGNLTFLDSFTTSLSIVGTILLAHKKIEAWFYWILADVLYNFIYAYWSLYINVYVFYIFCVSYLWL